jgi:hypothetical protein
MILSVSVKPCVVGEYLWMHRADSQGGTSGTEPKAREGSAFRAA